MCLIPLAFLRQNDNAASVHAVKWVHIVKRGLSGSNLPKATVDSNQGLPDSELDLLATVLHRFAGFSGL